jgi:translation initiation factor 3 subunit A
VGSNADKEKRIALDQLHSIIGVKRKNVWTKAYEPLMKKHIELCVDLKDHHTAKDGLHQYRNLCVSVDPSSLEAVILHLIELSETSALRAKQKADKYSLAAANRVADLEQEESPESIMLSSMTVDGVKERTDREVVIPWLRFLWENYRAVLELLYRLPKLEKTYHKTCEKAFKFCIDYNRTMEFKRLCDMLRMQLNNIQKQPITSAGRITKQAWEWTPESMEYHLQTRFAQLEVATTFELWNEAFRTIEDINSIIALSKKTPKAKLMITYYEKLTRIFAVADNKLFHAYSWLKYYQWSIDGRKDMKAEEKAVMASSVVLAALSVPSVNDMVTLGNVITEEEENPSMDKSSQLATLLDFQSNPSRQLLLSEIVNLGLLDEVLPELKGLYESLEMKFFPLQLIKTILPSLVMIRNHSLLSHYSESLEKIAIIRVLHQLSRVYNTVKLDFLYRLFSDLKSFSFVQIERLLLEAVINKQLNLSISHAQGIVTFKTVTTSSQAIDTQASKLGNALNKVSRMILLSNDVTNAKKIENRRMYISKIAENEENDFIGYTDRKVLIERRKEELERIQQEKAKEEKRLREIEENKRLAQEKERQEEEERRRNIEKYRKLQEKKEIAKIQGELEKYNVKMEESALAELDWDARVQLVVDAQNEALKTKEEENRKLQDQAKRLDYSVRALRLECAEIIRKKHENQSIIDNELLNTKTEEIQKSFNEKRSKDLEEKVRLSKTEVFRQTFESNLLQKQREDYDRQITVLKKRLIQEKRDAKIQKARRAAYEEQARIEEENKKEEERLENERLEQERYERLRKQREEEEEADRQREKEAERQEKLRIEAEERKAQEAAKRAAGAEEEAQRSSQNTKPRVDPFGRPVEDKRSSSDMFGGAKARDDGARSGGAYRSGPPPSTADRGDRPDPFDNMKRGGQRSSEQEPPRRSGGGGFDNFNRGPPPPSRRDDGEDRGGDRPPAAGGAGKYVPPTARGGGAFGGSRDRDDGPPRNERASAFRGQGDDRRPPAGGPGADRGDDRRPPADGPGADRDTRDRRPPERRTENSRSEGGWR